MKYYILTFSIAFAFLSQAQTKDRTLETQGNFILATYYYKHGAIQQQGFFNKDGTLDGLWSSYTLKVISYLKVTIQMVLKQGNGCFVDSSPKKFICQLQNCQR